jgi:hypothetical protein
LKFLKSCKVANNIGIDGTRTKELLEGSLSTVLEAVLQFHYPLRKVKYIGRKEAVTFTWWFSRISNTGSKAMVGSFFK